VTTLMLHSPEAFWHCMSEPTFRRIDIHTGIMLNGLEIRCKVAPEEVPGFLKSKLDESFSFLGIANA